jgi:hypothetical protein
VLLSVGIIPGVKVAVEIAAWLRELGLEHYEPVFCDHEVDWEVLREFAEQDLEKLNLPLGSRKKLQGDRRALALTGTNREEPWPRLCRKAQRQLTVTFVDLIGSMALSGRLDPEHVCKVMHGLPNTAISLSSTAIAPVRTRFADR